MIRRLARVGDSSHGHHGRVSTVLPWGKLARRGSDGRVPVDVGEKEDDTERFAVRPEFLGRPAFVELLRRSAAEYGFEQRGVLRIPCPASLFRRLLEAIAAGEDADAELLHVLEAA